MHFYDTLTFMILRNATVPIFAIDFYYKYLYYNRTVDDRFTRSEDQFGLSKLSLSSYGLTQNRSFVRADCRRI